MIGRNLGIRMPVNSLNPRLVKHTPHEWRSVTGRQVELTSNIHVNMATLDVLA